ncbi:hypothetical protein ACFLQ6_07995 [Thermoproteota archaeon]
MRSKTHILDSVVSCGLVLRATVNEWDLVKRIIQQEIPTVKIVYHTCAVENLRIINEHKQSVSETIESKQF